MKNYALTCLFCILVLKSSFAAIKNGYEKDIMSAWQSLRALQILLSSSKSLTASQMQLLKIKIDQHVDFIGNYQLTEQLLEQFRLISPGLYSEIDSIKDKIGRPVEVYVKFVHANLLPEPFSAFTRIEQHKDDETCFLSEYGINTVSISVAIEKKSLRLLAHEFGHVRYLVPNISVYLKYFINYYRSIMPASTLVGHYPGDPSGLSAQAYETKFRGEYSKFVKNKNSLSYNPIALLQRTKKDLINE